MSHHRHPHPPRTRCRGPALPARMSGLALVALGLLGGCSLSSGPSRGPAPTAAPAAPATAPPATRPMQPGQGPVGSTAAPGGRVAPPPRPARHWDEYQRQAAQRLVQANGGSTYMGVPPEPLLAIPVLEVELNGDGSVRKVSVLRRPRQATDTIQLAIDAVHRAAPFPSPSHLPRPWKYTEVFLFDDARRFKPRTLDDD